MKFKNLKAKLLAAGLAATLLGATIIPSLPVEAASNYTVNLSKSYQTIQGFGGMNHPIWISDLSTSQINKAYGTGTDEMGLNILRIHVDENKNNWSRELATAKAAAAKGAIVFATPWNPPSSMTEPITKNGRQTKRLKTSSYGAYADYLNEFVTYMKNNGVELYAISIQNEPDWGYEWTWWDPSEVYNFTKYYAGKINCRVISAESFSYNKSYYNNILNDSAALDNVDIIATHFYGTTESQMAYSLYNQKASNKPLWMTEVYVPNSSDDADKWPGALDVASNISSAMSNNFSAYVWWYIRRSYGLLKENGNISKRGYCMAQYSKFVKSGYKRVETTAKPDSNVYVTAYKGDDGKAVVVVVNKNSSQLSKSITLSGGTASKCTSYRTSASENLASANVSVSNNTINVSLPGNSVTTYVFDLGSSSGNQGNQGDQGNQGGSQGGNDQGGSSSSTNTNDNATAKIENGWYYIKNTNSQKYLTVEGNKAAANTNVCISSGTGADGQKWYVTNTNDGYITLTSALGNFMLDVANGASTDGTNIIIYNGYSGDAQKYVVKTTSKSGIYTIATKASSSARHLDCYNKGTSDGTNVCQWSYNGGANQQWQFEKVDQNNNQGSQTGNDQGNQGSQTGNDQGNQGNQGGTTPTPATTEDLKAEFTINSWNTGYNVSVKISNKTGKQVSNWVLKLKKSDCNMDSSWNVKVKTEGDYYIVTPVDWNNTIPNGGSVDFGFNGTGSIGNTIGYTISAE